MIWDDGFVFVRMLVNIRHSPGLIIYRDQSPITVQLLTTKNGFTGGYRNDNNVTICFIHNNHLLNGLSHPISSFKLYTYEKKKAKGAFSPR